jgi:hypothetical protein
MTDGKKRNLEGESNRPRKRKKRKHVMKGDDCGKEHRGEFLICEMQEKEEARGRLLISGPEVTVGQGSTG